MYLNKLNYFLSINETTYKVIIYIYLGFDLTLQFYFLMEIIASLIDYFFGKSNDFYSKAISAFLVILVAFCINDYFDLSNNFVINNKIEKLTKLKELAPEQFEKDVLIQKQILELKTEITAKREPFGYLTFFKKQVSLLLSTKYLSGICLYLLAMVIVLYFVAKAKEPIEKKIISVVLSETLLLVIVYTLIYIIDLIPKFNWEPFNQLINFSIQVLSLVIFNGKIRGSKQKA